MEILHFKDLGDLGYVASGSTSPLYKIWKQSDHYLWRYCILKIWGIRVSFGCERSFSSLRRVSNFNSKVAQGVSTYISNLKEIGWIFFELECSRHLGGGAAAGGGGDAKTIISPNTSFGDIMISLCIVQNIFEGPETCSPLLERCDHLNVKWYYLRHSFGDLANIVITLLYIQCMNIHMT